MKWCKRHNKGAGAMIPKEKFSFRKIRGVMTPNAYCKPCMVDYNRERYYRVGGPRCAN